MRLMMQGLTDAAFERRFGAKGLTLRAIHADIGPTGDWGYPTDPQHAVKWPRYALALNSD